MTTTFTTDKKCRYIHDEKLGIIEIKNLSRNGKAHLSHVLRNHLVNIVYAILHKGKKDAMTEVFRLEKSLKIMDL